MYSIAGKYPIQFLASLVKMSHKIAPTMTTGISIVSSCFVSTRARCRVVHPSANKCVLRMTRHVLLKQNHRSFASLPSQVQSDLDAVVNLVRKYDPSGSLPGTLLPNDSAKLGYFAVRAFWVETGQRFTSLIEKKTSDTKTTTPQERIQWWRDQISSLYSKSSSDTENQQLIVEHPTLRLLDYYNSQHEKALSPSLLVNILDSRDIDFNVKQYSTVQDLIEHSQQSCGSLLKLVMECAGVYENATAEEATNFIGVCHGITNALRTSIPIASQTGKIIIPADLCAKYGVRSPRFLLSALGQGDEKCKEALDNAVRDLVVVAREHLTQGRLLRDDILLQKRGKEAVSVLLPGVASETFLNRLEKKNYDLTDPNLRNISFLEHGVCSARMVNAWLRKTY